MSSALSLILLTILTAVSSECEEDVTFGAGHIIDIMLDDSETTYLVLKLNNGIYDYCRSLALQSGDLSFEEISCSNNIEAWQTFPNYDIDISFGDYDADAFRALNESDQIDYVESVNGTDISIFFNGNENAFSLPNIFIHPWYYSYFYSPSMKTLFIMTADQNETIEALSLAFRKINLITISWNPTGSEGVFFASDLSDFEVRQQNDITGSDTLGYFVGDANKNTADPPTIILDGEQWTTYDDDDMFMVRINSEIDDCQYPEWLRYSYIHNVYSSDNSTFMFDSAGHGFEGVDTRIKRAYGFTGHSVWYYESDDDRFDAFRIEYFSFEHKELSSYWALMWFLIALVLLCCCCCCVYWVKRKRDKQSRSEERFGMTAEQEMMTTNV